MLTRRHLLAAGAAAAPPRRSPRRASPGPRTEVNFVEAVHNLGYIDLYVGQAAGYFEKQGIRLNVRRRAATPRLLPPCSDNPRCSASVIPPWCRCRSRMADQEGGRHRGAARALFRRLEDREDDHRSEAVQGPHHGHLAGAEHQLQRHQKLLEENGLVVGQDVMIAVNPGTEIAAMLAGQADVAIAYQPGVAAAEAQGAKIVFDFASYMGPFCNTGIMVLNETITRKPQIIQALCNGFEMADRRVYSDPDYAKSVARRNSPTCPATWSTRRSRPN